MYTDVSSSLEISNKYNWTIGGLIGELESGKVQSAVLTGTKETAQAGDVALPAFSVQFDKDKSEDQSPQYGEDDNVVSGNFVIGGIVGKQTGGQIINTGIYCDIKAFTNDEQIGVDQILKVGGIVGESTASAKGTNSGVVMCYTDSKVNITGGNIYSFKKTYVAGISGYGGTIYQCKNEASILAQASYYYTDLSDLKREDVTKTQSGSDKVNGQWFEQEGYIKKADITFEYQNYGINYIAIQQDDGSFIIYSYTTDQNKKTDTTKSLANGASSVNEEWFDSHEWDWKFKSDVSYTKQEGEYTYYGEMVGIDEWKVYKILSNVNLENSMSSKNGFITEDERKKGDIDENTYQQYYNCYNKPFGTSYKNYNKLLFARIQQQAYSGGIANNYTTVESCLNTSSDISGGMDSKNLHSVYEFDDSHYSTTMGFAYFGFIYYGAGLLGPVSIMITASSIAYLTWDLDEYYFGGNGYIQSNENSYYISGKYSYIKPEDFINNVINTYESMLVNLFRAKDWHLPSGILVINNKNLATKEKFQEVAQNYSSEISSFTSNSQDYYASNSLEIYDIYFDSIGLPASGSEDDKKNSFSTTQVFSTITNNGTEYYKVNDNSKVSDGSRVQSASDYYGIVYKSSVMDKLTKKSNESDISGLIGNGFEKIGDDYKLSMQTKNATMKNLLKKVKIDGATNTIIIDIDYSDIEGEKPNEIYNKAVEMINTIYPKMTDKEYDTYKDKQNIDDDEELSNLLDEIKTIVKTVDSGYSYLININTSLKGVTLSLGTKNNPFVGKIVGSGIVNYRISGIEVPSLIDYGKDVTVHRLDLEYNEINVSNDETSIGGVISYADGKTIIERVNVSYSVSTYSVDVRGNVNPKQNGINIGGFIGENNGTTAIANSNINTLNVDIRANSADKGTETYGVGGFVGKNKGELILQGVKITKENIYAKNSQNDIFGGAVGLSEGTLNVKSVTVGNNESSIDVESMTTQTIVGGLVGKIESGSTCSMEDTKISLKGIYAKTSNESATIYAGGLVGYDNANLDTSTFKQVYVGEKDSKIKMLVYSGISGSKFANKAYASDVIGNKSVELDSNTSAVNVTSKAFAKPTYTKYAPNYDTRGTVKIEADDVIRSKTKIIESAKTGNYLKVDLFEYGTESFNGSKNVNSYVNGKEYVPFNYQKSYLLSVIVKTSYSASGTDKRYEFSERFYRITFTGAPSQDDELDIGCSYTIEFIAYNEYITDTDIYGSYKSIAYPLQNRYHNYVPSDVKTFYKANNVDLDDINEDTEIFEECDTVTDNINSIVKASYFDSVSNKIKVNYSNVSSEISIISYKNIYIDENYALKFEISDESSDDNVIDGENLAKFYTSEPEDGNNKTKVNSYGYTLKHDYKIVTSETTNRFAFRFNIEDKEKNSYEKRYYDIVEPELEQETSSIKIYEKVINIDGNNKNYRKIYIISNQTVNDKTVECVEDVYIVSSDGISYYMGNLQYKYSSENIDEKVSQRTGLFFPFVASEGDSTVNNFIKICDYYQNNLLSLTDVEQKNVFVITKNITATQNIWYFDVQYGATDPEFELNSRNNSSRLHKIEIKERRTDTYTFKVTASDVDYTLTSEKGETSYSETFQEVMQGIFIHKDNDGKEVAKYTINSASWKNASGDGKYDFKSVTINYTVENATSPTEVTFTWQYKTDKDGKTDNYIVREVTVNNTIIYTAEFTKIGDISYLVGNNETYLMFGTNTTQYTIAGEYTITKTSDGNYKLTNNLTGSSKISYIIIDKDGNVLEIVYKQLDLYVKEDYTNDNILISKYEDFSSSTTIEYTFDEYNIKTNTQTDKICHTYLVENYDTMMIYYSLNKMSDDSEIQLFSQDLVVMKRNVVQLKGSSVYVYVVDDKLSVYNGSKEIVKDKAVDKSFDIGKITLNEENDIKYITIGDMKIDISNGLVYLGTETKTVEEASTGYSITYNAIKYEEKTIFEIYQNDSGTNTLCGKIEIASKNATIGSLWALNKGEFVILCSDGKYYSLDGQYYYTGKGISKNTSLSKTYTALGGISASFDVYDVNLTQYNKDGSYQVTINQKVIIQTSETNLEIQSGKLTVSTEFSESFANESKFELSERSQIEEKGCIVISYINLDNSADYDIYTRQTDSSDNFIDLYKNRSGTEKTKSQLETDGYIPYKYVKYEDGNVVISANIEYDKENKEYYYNLRQESTIKIDSVERQLYTNNVRDKLYRTSNDGNSTLIKTYTFTINYMYDKKPNYYDAVRVITGTDGEVVEYPYGDKTLGYNGYPTIDGLNLFDIKVSSIQNENIQIDE